VLEEHKLAIFNIPKNNFSLVLRLALRMMGRADWKECPNPKANVKYLSHFSPAEAARIMRDGAWTKAVFLNEPQQRLLSVYLDLVACSDYFEKKFGEQPRDFAAFVAASQTHADPHWASQTDHIGDKWWGEINFVGTLANAEGDMEQLLRRVGAWEQHGASGWGEGGVQRVFAGTNAPPSAGASGLCQVRQGAAAGAEHFTPELEQEVKKR